MRTLSKIQRVLFTVMLMVSIPISAYGVDGQRKLTQPVSPASFPIVINQPGSYVLTSNLVVTDPNVNAIEITDSHITLDLNGHMIRGPNSGGSGQGIYSVDGYNITIKNGSIWGFGGRGIYLYATGGKEKEVGHCVKNIQAFLNSSVGIHIFSGLVTNCTANTNWTGIAAEDSTITNCTANNNAQVGIYGSYCTITNCTTSYNGDHGIGGAYALITNCIARYNSGDGIYAESATINNCSVCFNLDDGIHAGESTITNCTANTNNSDGIEAVDNNRIEGNTLRNNDINGGTGYGLNITSNNNYAIKNVASDNGAGNFNDSGTNNYVPLTGDNANYSW